MIFSRYINGIVIPMAPTAVTSGMECQILYGIPEVRNIVPITRTGIVVGVYAPNQKLKTQFGKSNKDRPTPILRGGSVPEAKTRVLGKFSIW